MKPHFLFEPGRLAALSDGVFAIVLTLLALDLKPNEANSAGLFADLRQMLPRLEIWAVSFLAVAAIWAMHHNIFAIIKRINNTLNWLNLFLLMSVTLVPWTTDLAGTYRDRWAVVLFSANMGFIGLVLALAWAYASGPVALTGETLTLRRRRYILLRLARIPLVAILSICLTGAHRSWGLWAWGLFLPLGLALSVWGDETSSLPSRVSE